MNAGKKLNTPGAGDVADYLEDFLIWSEQREVTVVLAAGNEANSPLHERVPQKFSTAANNIITVGSVNQDGTPRSDCSPGIPGEDGSMTVFAPGTDIAVPGNAGDIVLSQGTSPAAAMVVSSVHAVCEAVLSSLQSGLAAYFWSLPNVASFLFENNGLVAGDKMKNLIRSHAWTRIPLPIRVPEDWSPVNELPVVYNLARGDPAHNGLCVQKRAGDQLSACEVRTSESSSTLTTTFRYLRLLLALSRHMY